MLKPDTQIVYLCLDNDDAGHKASERMAEQLHERGVMTERLVPELKDWNDDLLHAQKEELSSMPESMTPLIASAWWVHCSFFCFRFLPTTTP